MPRGAVHPGGSRLPAAPCGKVRALACVCVSGGGGHRVCWCVAHSRSAALPPAAPPHAPPCAHHAAPCAHHAPPPPTQAAAGRGVPAPGARHTCDRAVPPQQRPAQVLLSHDRRRAPQGPPARCAGLLRCHFPVGACMHRKPCAACMCPGAPMLTGVCPCSRHTLTHPLLQPKSFKKPS